MITYKNYSSIYCLKKYWSALIPDDDERFYQTYRFNLLCYKYRKTSISNIMRRNTRCFFLAMFDDDDIVCIAPLVIDETPIKVIHILGHGTNAGYLDFIYGAKFCEQLLDDMLLKIHSEFPCYTLNFTFVKEDSVLTLRGTIIQTYDNYHIVFSSYNTFFNSLSQSTRQNIRTAYNRVSTDGISCALKYLDSRSTALMKELRKVNLIYQKRRIEWGEPSAISSIAKTTIILYRDVVYRSLRKFKNAKLYTLILNGKIAAFLIGYQCDNHFYVPRLAICSDYSRYSPGIMLICEILKQQRASAEPFVFDLGRGSEGYKSRLGGILTSSNELNVNTRME